MYYEIKKCMKNNYAFGFFLMYEVTIKMVKWLKSFSVYISKLLIFYYVSIFMCSNLFWSIFQKVNSILRKKNSCNVY